MRRSFTYAAIGSLILSAPAVAFGAGGHGGAMGGGMGGAAMGGMRTAPASSSGATTHSTASTTTTSSTPTPRTATQSTGQPNQSCQAGANYPANTPGNSYNSPGSAFDPNGVADSKYAGTQPQNSRNPNSVSQYDVACTHQK
jgi:hypothetical protein